MNETTLTDAEREALKVALYGNRAKTLTLEGGPVCEAVECIVAARVERVVAGVRTWCAINEIDEPPLDWEGLGEFLSRALLSADDAEAQA